MTRFTALAAALMLTAGTASAQDVATTQSSVTPGATGVAGYPDAVVGANGATYACTAPTTVDGILVRRCLSSAGGATTTGMGTISAGAAVGAGLGAIVLVALVANDDDDENTPATTTN